MKWTVAIFMTCSYWIKTYIYSEKGNSNAVHKWQREVGWRSQYPQKRQHNVWISTQMFDAKFQHHNYMETKNICMAWFPYTNLRGHDVLCGMYFLGTPTLNAYYPHRLLETTFIRSVAVIFGWKNSTLTSRWLSPTSCVYKAALCCIILHTANCFML